tara:strand:+ start:153 stop:371 length:219 start_codon:yes stop_codon:yes gene_type:complete
VKISCSTKQRLQRLFSPWNALLFKHLRGHHDHDEAPESERLFGDFDEEDVACSDKEVMESLPQARANPNPNP